MTSALEAGKDVTKDDMEIVSAVHRALAGKVGQERFAVWFGRGVRMEPCGTTLRIAAADTFRLDYLQRAFRADLIAAAKIAGSLFDITLEGIEFVLDSAVAGSSQAASDDAAPSSESPAPGTDNRPATSITPSIRLHAAPTSGRQFPDAPARKPHLPKRQFADLSQFLCSDANRVAMSAAQTVATRPGAYTPLTFVGPPGCGKTHLLEGIWRQARNSGILSSVVFLTAEQFTNQFIDAIRNQGSGTPSFRRKVRGVEMLIIDDLQFLAGKSSTITELVHTIDALVRNRRQLVFAADRPLAEIRGLGPDIPARLAGGLICTLEPADYGVRLGILQQIAKRQNIDVPGDVLAWLASQLDGDVRHLAGALNRLQAASEAHEERIDLTFAQASLADLIHACRRPVRLPEIMEAVCDVMGVESKDLQSRNKSASSNVPRMLVMFLARKYTRAALSEISQSLGRKSHSTVLTAQQKVTQWLASGKKVDLGRGECRVEDAIKRIECQLRLA